MLGTVLGIVGAAVGVAGVILALLSLRKLISQTTAADQERADKKKSEDLQRHENEIRDARIDERDKCRERMNRILAELAEMTTDRNAQRARADALQQQINDRGLGPR